MGPALRLVVEGPDGGPELDRLVERKTWGPAGMPAAAVTGFRAGGSVWTLRHGAGPSPASATVTATVMQMAVTHLPPRGHYMAREAGWLAGVSGDRIGQWARRGYIHSSQSSKTPRIYSYQDVAEAMVVHELRQASVPLRVIKRTIDALREAYGDWPLTKAELLVSDDTASRKALLLIREGGALFEAASARLQSVIDPGNLRRIADQLHHGGWVVRELPGLEHIEVDPDLLSGRPTIKGRRVPAEEVARTAATEEGRRLLREDYDLSDQEIADAVRWWEAVSRVA